MANPKLNQVIAATKDVTAHSQDEVTQAYHTMQKPDLFGGQTRTYAPRVDGEDGLPAEQQNVQTTVQAQVDRLLSGLANILDVTATRNWGNTQAKADIVVEGHTVLKDVPVEYLLFLETQLKYIATALKVVPTLDPAFRWTKEESDGLYHAEPVQSIRLKQVLRNHVKAEATDKHPAQVETYTEQEPTGTWTTTKLSGAAPATQVQAWHEKLVKLMQAVKFAREEANSLEVPAKKVGRELLDYVFS